jgi:hypothetical protein
MMTLPHPQYGDANGRKRGEICNISQSDVYANEISEHHSSLVTSLELF